MAQERGYAEADPTLDIDGTDAAQHLTILVALAHHIKVPLNQVHTEGITKIVQNDIQYAQELGYTVKLLAITKSRGTKIDVRVHPTLIPNDSMLANVSDAFNAVGVVGNAVGPTLFYGQGAGEMPTASAVVADIIDAARSINGNSHVPIPPAWVSKPHSDFSIGLIQVFWSERRDLHPRALHPQCSALPGCATLRQGSNYTCFYNEIKFLVKSSL